jgi:hypothetical protein
MALALRSFGQRARFVARCFDDGEGALEVPVLDLPDQIQNFADIAALCMRAPEKSGGHIRTRNS